jgi:hypothetical protein
MVQKIAFALFLLASLVTAAPALAAGGTCNFDSDCGKGVKCNGGKCANSGGSSCNYDSDCGGGGAKCNSGKCSNAPDGKCNYDSECAGTGKCSSGKCK